LAAAEAPKIAKVIAIAMVGRGAEVVASASRARLHRNLPI